MSAATPSPLVSILIPAYNREREIEETVRSALAQTVLDIEVVVVDNASTDGTWAICQRLAEEDGRLRLFRNDANIGPVNNWRRCVAEARAPVAKILFSDDRLEPTYLERTLPRLQGRVAFVFTPAKLVDEAGASHGTIHQYFVDTFPSDTFVFEYLSNFGGLPVSPCAALFRTADLRDGIISDLGPGPGGDSASDFDAHGAGPDCLIYLIAASRYPYVVHVAEPLVTFRRGGITSDLIASGRFFACYHHALMWFMKSPMAPSPARLAAAALWRQEVRNARRVIPYEDYLRAYGVDV
ncbi:glycosyltransferase family 2 protein (plasmid) [Azospirillum sp. HJ39]|uniref:glycosyltransferase family 2 protein n=1 Tax=Azospirillum sp. HJ39 TaxID=3159496 RepID=UPI003558320C